jgi:hypothetical protein
MTELLAPSAPALPRVRIGILLLTLVTLGLGALFAPEIKAGVIGLFTPCAGIVQKPDISKLLGPNSGLNTVQPFYLHAQNPAEQDRAVRCLTDAIYYEAANEPIEGQRAVAQVVVNRVRDKHFPKSVCGVVYEGWERRTGCQFSFVCDGSIRRRHADPAAWGRLRPIAAAALNGSVAPEVGTATHYYATYVRPNWLRSVLQITEIGKHVFCSWRGKAGMPSALASAYEGGEFQVADAALDGARPQAAKAPVKTARASRTPHSVRLARLFRHEAHGRIHARYA